MPFYCVFLTYRIGNIFAKLISMTMIIVPHDEGLVVGLLGSRDQVAIFAPESANPCLIGPLDAFTGNPILTLPTKPLSPMEIAAHLYPIVEAEFVAAGLNLGRPEIILGRCGDPLSQQVATGTVVYVGRDVTPLPQELSSQLFRGGTSLDEVSRTLEDHLRAQRTPPQKWIIEIESHSCRSRPVGTVQAYTLED